MHRLSLQESQMNMCRVQLWFGCTLRRWRSFNVMQTPALNSYQVQASGRTALSEKFLKGMFSVRQAEIKLEFCPK